MKVLVTGGKGQLGRELRRCLETMRAEIGPIPEVYAAADVDYIDLAELDITNQAAVNAWFDEHGPYDAVFNCVAYTNVDGCEEHEDVALKANGDAVGYLAQACQACGAVFVHVSTDYVFPGTDPTPRVETDEPHPISAYGRTKLVGEKNALAFCDKSFVVRTAWLYGYEGKNFVQTMMRVGASHPKATVVNDQLGNPTHANDLAYEMLVLATTTEYGIYHCTGEGICSWFDFATAIMEGAGLGCVVEPCTSAQWKEMHPESADRPAFSALENRHLAQTCGNEMRPWREALASYFTELKKAENQTS